MFKDFCKKSIVLFIILILCSAKCIAKEKTFASLAPSITEIIYKLGAEDSLVAVSTECNYPKETKKKEVIGNTYFLDKEKLIKLAPNYLLTVEGAQFANYRNMPKQNSIKPICYTMDSVNAVYETILSIGELTNKRREAIEIVREIASEADNIKSKTPRKILYLIQINPIITIGNKSYISDVIRKSGQENVTDEIDAFYPVVTNEYIIKTKPDIIIVSDKTGYKKLERLFPHARIIYLTEDENSKINRPGPRINESIKFFANIDERG
ncbi:ABC transporter substrate-binding protein [bacterium]|nr:ABC transporter substrate-binding protein [bacterium]